jgi:general secretion pathway protein H
MTPRRKTTGFSLLELLVVVFIIGILATMFTLSVGLTGGDRDLEREADRLQALLQLASEEALMQGREIGMRFYADGYEFATFQEDFLDYHDPDPEEETNQDEAKTLDQSEWVLVGQQEMLGPRHLPEDIVLELEIDGRAVVLTPESEREDNDDDAEKTYRPQIRIFSSGDFIPFVLRLRRKFQNATTTLDVGVDGTVEVTEEGS